MLGGTDKTPLEIFKYFQQQALEHRSEAEVTPYQRVTALKTWSLLAGVAKKFTEVSGGLDRLERWSLGDTYIHLCILMYVT